MVEFNWLAWVQANVDMLQENRGSEVEVVEMHEQKDKQFCKALMEDIDESMFDDLPF